jgi:serine protease Do
MKMRASPIPVLLMLLCLWLAGPGPAQAALDRSQALQLSASVLKIEVLRAQGGYSLGSGVVVAPDRVVTNCHVTRDAGEIHVLRGGMRWTVEAQAADVEHDLCMLRVPRLPGTPARMGQAGQLKPGQAVSALGYTGGLGLQNSEGSVVALHKLDGSQVVQSTNWFTSGASGGGLFDDDARLVGILTFRLRGGHAHYFAAPVEWLQPLMAESAAWRKVSPLDPTAKAYWEKPRTDQPNFLQAAALEGEQRWDELEMLAFNWTRLDTSDPQPWYLHGLALDGLHRLPESQRALERSLALEPGQQQGWYRLGLVYLQQGLLDRARAAVTRLERLQPELALDLKQLIDTRSPR